MKLNVIMVASAVLVSTGSVAVAQDVSGSTLAGRIDSQCGFIEYVDDCFSALRRALTEAEGLSGDELTPIHETMVEIIEENPNQADDIREIVAESGVDLGEI